MAVPARTYLTIEEAIAIDEASPVPLEYWNGRMYWQGEEVDLTLPLEKALKNMAGGTPRHAVLGLAVGAEARSAMRARGRSGCLAHGADVAVYLPDGTYIHPDVAVVCGSIIPPFDHPTGVTNPVVLVEVLSPSTEGYDRGDKFHRVKTLDSLQHYVLVAQGRASIDVLTRQADGAWALRTYRAGDSFRLDAIDVELSVDAIYEGVELDPVGPPPAAPTTVPDTPPQS
jgi:Uma2 family endonuclease